jgi:hypothetical protein
MSVDEQARADYKEGQADAKKSVPEQAMNDIPATHPDSKAYYDARKGVPLDADKDKSKK